MCVRIKKQHKHEHGGKKKVLLSFDTMRPLTTVVRLPESEPRGIGLSTGWQGQVEEQSVSG